jgi:hypothetical protein
MLHKVCLHCSAVLPFRAGSYGQRAQGVCVSLIGRNASTVAEVANEVVGEVEGQLVSDEELEIAKMEPRTSAKASL